MLTRRDLLKRVGAITAGLKACTTGVVQGSGNAAQGFLGRRSAEREGGSPAVLIAGRPVEIAITPISALTTRIGILAIDDGRVQAIPNDGSLVARTWPAPAARIRTLTREQTVRSGDLTRR